MSRLRHSRSKTESIMSVTGILGKKIGMTQLFDDKGEVHPVTVLQAGPCVVTQLKTLAGDGYSAAQIGLIEFVKGGKGNKPVAGHFGAKQITVRNLRIRGIDLDENLLMVEGAIPGPREGYVMISKSKAPPRERRGFGGGGTVDPLKASKKASGGKPSGAKKK